MIHQITAKWLGKMAFDLTNPGGNLKIDADEALGGENNGLRPKALMLDALAGCSALDVASLLPKMKVVLDTFHVDCSGELTDEHPKYYHTVSVDYHFYGKDLDQQKLEKIVYLSVDKYCGVMEMFRKFAKINIQIHYHNH